MNFEQKIEQFKQEMHKHISTKDISLLKDLDSRIKIIKEGKFNFYMTSKYSSYLEHRILWNFFKDLDDKKVYTLIPFISANNNPNEPYIILSRQILLTNHSNSLLITRYINDKIVKTINLYKMYELDEFNITFKYKQIEFEFKEHDNFIN